MDKRYINIVILILVFSSFVSIVCAQISDNKNHTLWYTQPARLWTDALPIGNGRMGAMVYGDYTSERIQINEESLWSGCKTESDADARSSLKTIQQLLLDGKIVEAAKLAEESLKSDPLTIRSYQPVGDIIIDYPNPPRRRNANQDLNYQRKLNLETGIASSTFVVDGVKYTQEVFASSVDDIIAVRIKADQPGKLTFKLSLTRGQDAIVIPSGDNELTMKGQVVDLPRAGSSPAGIYMKFAAQVIGQNKGGKLTTVNNSMFVENADEVVFYFTAATDYNLSLMNYDRSIDPVQKCASILSKVKAVPYETVMNKHVADHSAMFNRVSFDLYDDTANAGLPTDKRMDAYKQDSNDKGFPILLFQYGRYMLMGSSRSPGILPATLQGIWNQEFDAPWGSDFHTNINIQMNYWSAEVCNLSETFIPFNNLINALRVPGRVTAQKTYNSTGWTTNHLTDVYGRTAISDGVEWGAYPMGGSWLVLHQWEHYQFTKDLNYLRTDAYPSMKEAADFVLNFIIKDKNGKWVTAPSNSPENSYRLPSGETFMLTYGATKDIQLIREFFNACIKAGNLLGEDKKYIARLQSVINDLPPTKVSKRYGIIQEWIEDYEEVEPGHRHISSLFGLYPGTEITSANKPLFDAAAETIRRRHEYAMKGQGISRGWTKAWQINFFSRLENGEAAWQKVIELGRDRSLVNLFNNNTPFQIDGNLGLTAGIAEMLIQSHQGNIHMLPAIPQAWDKGEVKGLKARGNITVNMKWDNNKLISSSLVAANDCSIQVKYNGKTQKVSLKGGEQYQLDIAKFK